ncbi:hypothetical protein LRP49_16420 [Enterovibrio sp. ZSDZ35]|uniref:Lipoprotein n=1 Tax=Enterovibrio qingdaonensis TaxID=2899818 RepID=A0ABT5QQ91_9GAMM|nr:hypothetical protein [Enterovibrio sp. ZSDZ35]MDD1782759.1 hypothetical protein [Enterovibrio sp. ZSDZ35]
MVQTNLKLIAVVGMALAVASCAIKQPETTDVYIPKGAIQCETQGMTLSESTQRLASVGVTSVSAQCAEITGVMHSAVCGGQTGEIIVHTIATKEVLLAEQAGYKGVKALQSTGNDTGYIAIECK